MSERRAMADSIGELLDGTYSGDAAVAYLTQLKIGRLTPERLAGAVDSVMARAVGFPEYPDAVDCCIAQCEIPMPAFGPVEVHVWSDNAFVLNTPRQWWEIAPVMDLKFQKGGIRNSRSDSFKSLRSRDEASQTSTIAGYV